MTGPISDQARRAWRAAALDVTDEEIRAITVVLDAYRAAGPAARMLRAYRAGEATGRARQRHEDDERRRLAEADRRALDYLDDWWLPANHRQLDGQAVEAIHHLLRLVRELAST